MTTPTRHDASKVLLGTVGSSDRVISVENADPASFPIGCGIRRASDGSLSLDSSAGSLIGVSLGASLSDTKKTAVCRSGDQVPIMLTDEGVKSSLTLQDLSFFAQAEGAAGDAITIALVSDGAAGAETVGVSGTAITVHMDSTALTGSTAQNINDALIASAAASALIAVVITGDSTAVQAAAAATHLADGADSYPYVVVGQPVLLDTTTGQASSTGGAVTGATYESGAKDGVAIDGTIPYQVALIDMGGGL